MNHFSEINWDCARWPNFHPGEFACHCCGELILLPEHFDHIQAVRRLVGKPIQINSAHRCAIHNARIGGAPLSQHKQIAFDINLADHDKEQLLQACRDVGFHGFGFYSTFLHVDLGRSREWWTEGGKKIWTGVRF